MVTPHDMQVACPRLWPRPEEPRPVEPTCSTSPASHGRNRPFSSTACRAKRSGHSGSYSTCVTASSITVRGSTRSQP
jgi:hypothetical protein